MNRIKKLYNNIEVSDELKRKTYQRIMNKKYRKSIVRKNFIYSLSFALTSILILLLAFNYNGLNEKKPVAEDGFGVMLESTEKADTLFYNSHIYNATEESVKEYVLDKKIGTLKVIDGELKNNFNAYYHDGAYIYNIKNINNKLAVIDNHKIIIYKINLNR